MAKSAPETTDTVIVGNGPSALILSYILHGHTPYYAGGHPDNLLDQKLSQSPNLLRVREDLYSHLGDSLKYSSHALPVNTLLDTLLRPHGDGDIGSTSCVRWQYEPKTITKHIVLGNASSAGGQWANNPVKASLDIGTLSYAEQFSLPAYTFADHWRATKGSDMPELLRPSRRDVAGYFAAYPEAVGISDSLRSSAEVANVTRTSNGFYVASHNIHCRHLVLATGTFSINQPPPPFLRPLLDLPEASQGPLLVVGSGLTAADIIISTPPTRKIIHLFNWDPDNHPSPLRSCHHEAYPEYAGVYRYMRRAALQMANPFALQKPPKNTKANTPQIPYYAERNWISMYEGIANARILFVDSTPATSPTSPTFDKGRKMVTVQIGKTPNGQRIMRQISTFRYATGRRGSLSYLSKSLLTEVLPREKPVIHDTPSQDFELTHQSNSATSSRRSSAEFDFADVPDPFHISGHTLREKIEDGPGGMEVAKDVFVIGSLTGDSLVRLAFGSCTAVAGRLMAEAEKSPDDVIEDEIDTNAADTSKSHLFHPVLSRIMSAPEGPEENHTISQRPELGSLPEQPRQIVNGANLTPAEATSPLSPTSNQTSQVINVKKKKKGRCIVS